MLFQLDCDYQASKTLNGLLLLFIAFLIAWMFDNFQAGVADCLAVTRPWAAVHQSMDCLPEM